MSKEIKTLDDLTTDAENFNKHTEFGTKLLEDSLRKFGVIIARWEKLTGNKAERISDGND